MHSSARVLISSALAGAILACAGCVVAIGNRPTASESGRVKLASADLEGVAVVESPLQVPSFDEAYSAELSKLSPETTVEEFRELFPEARFIERSSAHGPPVDAWSVVRKQTYRYDGERRYGYIKREERWFYFQNGVFVKWGQARDWPRVD